MGAQLSDLEYIFALLIAFQIKHLIGDYLLQTGWMVRGKSLLGASFITPLSVHVGVHACLTLLIVTAINPAFWPLAIFDFALHFIIDRIKSNPRLLGRFNDVTKQSFWIPLGLDQMAHHFTHYAIIWWLIVNRV